MVISTIRKCIAHLTWGLDNIISIFKKYKMRCRVVGRIEKGSGEVAVRLAGRNETL